MKGDGLDTLFYILAFLAPGFVFHTVLAGLVPLREEKTEVLFLRCLILSVINYALWSWLIYLLPRAPFFLESGLRRAAAWGVMTLFSPVTLGLIAGRLVQRGTAETALQRMGLYPKQQAVTSWDRLFSRAGKKRVLVTLKDGRQVAGIFGDRSFASSDPSERDVYIESLSEIGDSGEWRPNPHDRGIWIAGEQIACIEFLGSQEDGDT
jgi:hypothetical protein